MPATFVIIGAMKSGTSTLREHLRTHPEVSMAKPAETHFFCESLNWSKGINWYRGQFDMTRLIRGDSSANYAKARTFPGVPQRIHELVPEAKLVYIVRDPLGRLVSHYMHNLAHGREQRDIEDALAEPETSGYVEASLYHHQLSYFLPIFSRESILLLTMEELARDPAAVMRRVFTHVGAAATHEPPALGKAFHKGHVKRAPSALTRPLVGRAGGKAIRQLLGPLLEPPVEPPVLTAALQSRLEGIFRPDVEALRQYSGLPLDRWCV